MVSSLWLGDDDEVAAWGEGLVRLVGRFLPKEVQVVEGTAFEQWPLVGPAYIAKASGTLETMFMLFGARRTLDATLLLRSLYENLLVFSWIAIVRKPISLAGSRAYAGKRSRSMTTGGVSELVFLTNLTGTMPRHGRTMSS